MIPKMAAVDSGVLRRFPPLQPVSPGLVIPAPKPRRIVLWDELGEAVPALMDQSHLGSENLVATLGPEKLAAHHGMRASLPSQLQLP